MPFFFISLVQMRIIPTFAHLKRRCGRPDNYREERQRKDVSLSTTKNNFGVVAEWLGRALQKLVQRFESAQRLIKKPAISAGFFLLNTCDCWSSFTDFYQLFIAEMLRVMYYLQLIIIYNSSK